MNKSENINELASALAKAQGQMSGARKDASNPYFKSKYADLASVWEACRIPLSENGLSVIQTTGGDGEIIQVETTVAHSSGQWISSALSMKPVKNDPQGVGSCITYARRYGLSAMVGIAPEDDDGNQASQTGKPSRTYKSEAPKPVQNAAIKKLVEDNPTEDMGDISDLPIIDDNTELDPNNWKDVRVHIGKKYIGKLLGELEEFQVEEIYDGLEGRSAKTKEDLMLKQAVILWKKEMDTLV